MKTCEQRCKECFDKCKAECCVFVPLSVKFIEKHNDKIQREIKYFFPYNKDKVVYPIVEIDGYKEINGIKVPIVDKTKQKCIFLDNNNRCVVYDERPEICKLFGTTTQDDCSLTCFYHLGKNYNHPLDGTPEKLKIQKSLFKYADIYIRNPLLLKQIHGEE